MTHEYTPLPLVSLCEIKLEYHLQNSLLPPSQKLDLGDVTRSFYYEYPAIEAIHVEESSKSYVKVDVVMYLKSEV
jgi:hypothetical protein